MKTPFTADFDRASIPLKRVAAPPFMPAQAMPFVDASHTSCFVGTRGQAIYRWHDAFDVFVVVLEASCKQAMDIPFKSHLADLHLVYQLQGTSNIHIDRDHSGAFPPITLPKGHRMEAYIPPVRGTLRVIPDNKTHRYALAAMVPKSDWVTRHPIQGDNPMDEIIRYLKQRHDTLHYLRPSPITPTMYTGLHILLTTPAYTGMRLDDALNGSMVSLLEEHRSARKREDRDRRNDLAFIEAARLLARQLVARMDGDMPPTTQTIAEALHTTEARLRKLHLQHHGNQFRQYIHTCRMEEAKKRLLTGLPISAIAYQLGWTEPANFSRDFKNHVGLSPLQYQQKSRR